MVVLGIVVIHTSTQGKDHHLQIKYTNRTRFFHLRELRWQSSGAALFIILNQRLASGSSHKELLHLATIIYLCGFITTTKGVTERDGSIFRIVGQLRQPVSYRSDLMATLLLLRTQE